MSRDQQTHNRNNSGVNPPRLMIAGVGGDSGKTLVTLGLTKSWRRRGTNVATFKKGPDYIDPAWLSLASGSGTRNLDTWMMGRGKVIRSFTEHAIHDGINLIEANRGLLDGNDSEGSHSSAVLATLLKTPVVVVLPVNKVTRTAAAVIAGLKQLAPDTEIAGVILNQVAGGRHLKVTRNAITAETGVPVLGAIPKLRDNILPGRHLGLVTPEETAEAEKAINIAADVVEENVDNDALIKLSSGCDELELLDNDAEPEIVRTDVRIAYFSGSAFTFYYPDNLEALEDRGAELLAVDPTKAEKLPECDALYIGGGFPETHVDVLSENRSFKRSLIDRVEEGLPVWAECGGLMFLSKSIITDHGVNELAGVFENSVRMHSKPMGHGYQVIRVTDENPFLPVGSEFRGHEFHYSQVEHDQPYKTTFEVKRGVGLSGGVDGLRHKNVVASYFHLHVAGCPQWADGMIEAAKKHRNRQK